MKTKIRDGICRRGSTWSVVIREKDPATGKSKPVWTGGFLTEDDAKAYRDSRRNALRLGNAVPRDDITVGEYLDIWLPAHIATKSLKPSTAHGYRSYLNWYVIPRIGGMALQAVRPVTISQLYTELLQRGKRGTGEPLSPASVQQVGTILKQAFKHAVVVYQLLPKSPAADVPIPRGRSKPQQIWTTQEMQQLFAVMNDHPLGPLFRVAAATGARRGEVLALRWDDVDFEERTLRFDSSIVAAGDALVEGSLKNDLVKVVPVDEDTLEVLRQHRLRQLQDRMASPMWEPADLVFCNRHGQGLHPRSLGRIWAKLITQAGVPYIKMHALRHTHATWLLEAGMPLHAVAQRLGHKDAMVTATVYAQVSAQLSRQGADLFSERISQPGH